MERTAMNGTLFALHTFAAAAVSMSTQSGANLSIMEARLFFPTKASPVASLP